VPGLAPDQSLREYFSAQRTPRWRIASDEEIRSISSMLPLSKLTPGCWQRSFALLPEKRKPVMRQVSRMLAALGAIAAGVVNSAPIARATPLDDCNSEIPATTIAGCSAVLSEAADPKPRAIALVRRGEAFEKKGDLGAAVVDFIAAVEVDPQNFYARQDLRRVSPKGRPQESADTSIWPHLAEGVDYPAGFAPTVDQNLARAGGDYHSFSPPAGSWTYCRAACFADAQCRAWEYRRAESRTNQSARCMLKAEVPEAVAAAGVVSGIIRPERLPAPPAFYRFIEGSAFGLRPDVSVSLIPLKASAFPTTGPLATKPPESHPLLDSYTAHALYQGAVCEVTGAGGGLRAASNAETLLRELVAAFGRPAPESTPRKYVWNLNSTTSVVILEDGPSVTIKFKNYRDCEAEEAALADLQRRIGGRMPTTKDLEEIFIRWPPLPPRPEAPPR
jgi:hypothetical protein